MRALFIAAAIAAAPVGATQLGEATKENDYLLHYLNSCNEYEVLSYNMAKVYQETGNAKDLAALASKLELGADMADMAAKEKIGKTPKEKQKIAESHAIGFGKWCRDNYTKLKLK